MKKIISLIFLVVICSYASGQVFLDSLLSNGLDERPHQLYSDEERRSLGLGCYDNSWVITIGGEGDVIVEEESLDALFNNDFYGFYHDAELDFSTPLKRKLFEQSENYHTMKEEFDMVRNFVIEDTLHMPIVGAFNYTHEYNIDKECFEFDLPNPGLYVPSHLSSRLRRIDQNYLSITVPMQNLSIASEIEDIDLPPHAYDFLVRFVYKDKPTVIEKTHGSNNGICPIIFSDTPKGVCYEVCDVILYNTAKRQVVWSLLLGDLSDTIK